MRLVILSAAVLSLAACATPTGPEAASSFDSFRAVTTSDFTGYDAVYIAPMKASAEVTRRVGINRPRRNNLRPLGEEDIADQLAAFQSALTKELGGRARMVSAPGPGVLTISATLTRLDANRPTMTEMSVEPALNFQSIYAGDSSFTIELSENGKLLAVIKDDDEDLSLADRQGAAFGIWDTARRHARRTAAKIGALLEG